MNTQKVAITVPMEIIALVDMISRQKGMSRSKYISTVLREKIAEERNRTVKEAYDRLFKDDEIRKEQAATSKWFEGSGTDEGQEW